MILSTWNPGSITCLLWDLRQVISPLSASIISSVKWRNLVEPTSGDHCEDYVRLYHKVVRIVTHNECSVNTQYYYIIRRKVLNPQLLPWGRIWHWDFVSFWQCQAFWIWYLRPNAMSRWCKLEENQTVCSGSPLQPQYCYR